jgi:hypothetical protein
VPDTASSTTTTADVAAAAARLLNSAASYCATYGDLGISCEAIFIVFNLLYYTLCFTTE